MRILIVLALAAVLTTGAAHDDLGAHTVDDGMPEWSCCIVGAALPSNDIVLIACANQNGGVLTGWCSPKSKLTNCPPFQGLPHCFDFVGDAFGPGF